MVATLEDLHLVAGSPVDGLAVDGLDLEIVVEETEVDGLGTVVEEIEVDGLETVVDSVIVEATVIVEEIAAVEEVMAIVEVEAEAMKGARASPVVDLLDHMVDLTVQRKTLLDSMGMRGQILGLSKSSFIPRSLRRLE